jgi:hypothetical protein
MYNLFSLFGLDYVRNLIRHFLYPTLPLKQIEFKVITAPVAKSAAVSTDAMLNELKDVLKKRNTNTWVPI